MGDIVSREFDSAEAATTTTEEQPAEVTSSETTDTATQITIQFGPVAQGVITAVLDLLVQFGMALFIFFFMISAAMALPGAVRMGLDPRAPVIGRITTLTGDVHRYLTILTGINFLVG